MQLNLRRLSLVREDDNRIIDDRLTVAQLTVNGATRMNLLAKGSRAHCEQQLGMTLEQHAVAAEATVRAARALGVQVAGAYLEDFSQGIAQDPGYVMALTARLLAAGVERIYLADTLGCLGPDEVGRYVRQMVTAFPAACFELHVHDDYGLATANVLAGVAAGVRGVHTSVNGMGERAGNARLAEVAVALHDHARVRTSVDERALCRVSSLVETFSGKAVADNTPVVGRDVFTQTSGVHADGDRKGGLYGTRLSPERFERSRDYALGKLAGRASVEQHLERLGLQLLPHERDRVLARIVELGDHKHSVRASELPLLIGDVLGRGASSRLALRDYAVQLRRGQPAQARVELALDERSAQAQAHGPGGYEALMTALQEAAAALGLGLPRLVDFRSRIAPGGDSSALVETTITFAPLAAGEPGFTTVGVDADQLGAAVIATEKMLQLVQARSGGARTSEAATPAPVAS